MGSTKKFNKEVPIQIGLYYYNRIHKLNLKLWNT